MSKTNIEKTTIPAREFGQYSPIVGGHNLKHYLKLAVRDIAHKVGATMGASGRTSGVLDYLPNGIPYFLTTKDGSNTLAFLKDRCLRGQVVLDYEGSEIPSGIYAAVASAIHSVAVQTEARAGDGTTATTIIAAALFEAAVEHVESNDMSAFCREIEKVSVEVINAVYASAVKDEDITEDMIIAVVTTSLNHDKELGKALGKAIFKAGKFGYCFVQGSKGIYEDRIEEVNGYTFACKGQPMFFNRGGKGVYEDPFIIVSADPIDDVVDAKGQKPTLKPLLEFYQNAIKGGELRPLVIFAPSIAGAAVGLIEMNFSQKNIPILYVSLTGSGLHKEQQHQVLEDISTTTGAKLFSTDLGMNLSKIHQCKTNPFGHCEKLFLEKENFYLQSPTHAFNFDKYTQDLLENIKSLDPSRDFDLIQWQQRRYASLDSSIIRVTVAVSSDAELKEREDSVRDASLAAFSALRKGIVTGGGITLYNLSEPYDAVFKAALRAPIKRITSNANIDLKDMELDSYPDIHVGVDVLNKKVRNFWEHPMILDPAESVAEAFGNGASIAKSLLSLETLNY